MASEQNRLYDPNAYQRWEALYQAREAPGADQNRLGPLEHGAYAESRVRERPVLGVIEQLAMIPGYTGAKALGLMDSRSPASVDEMAEAYRGVGRGVSRNVQELLRMLGM